MNFKGFYSLILLCVITLFPVLAQEKEGNWWVFGGGGFDRNMTFMHFSNGYPELIDKTAVTSLINLSTKGTISNAEGELQIYAQVDSVWNGNYELIENGSNILPRIISPFNTGGSSYPSLIVKHPGSDHKYHLISAKGYDYYDREGNQLGYNTIDMSLNGGKGGISPADKNIILRTEVSLSLSLHQHANDMDYWVVGHGLKNNRFHIYRLDAAGFSYHDSVAIGTDLSEQQTMNGCYMKASPNSELLAVAPIRNDIPALLELYKFDRLTGTMYDRVAIQRASAAAFVQPAPGAFSASGRFLYLPRHDSLFQYDLSVWDSLAIAQSKTFLGITGYNAQLPDLQLALDGKLYFICNYNTNELGVVPCPEIKGVGAGFIRDAIKLKGGGGPFLPTLNQTLFVNAGKLQAQAPNRGHICKGDSVRLSAYGGSMSSWVWSPAVGLSDPLSQNPTLLTDTTATYRVVGTSNCSGATDTAYVTVTVHEPPSLSALPAHVCSNEQFTAQVQNTEPGLSYQWQVNSGTVIEVTETTTAKILAGTGTDSLRLSVHAPQGKSCAGDTLRATVAVGYKAKIKTTAPADTCRYADTLKINYTTGFNTGSSYLWQFTNPAGITAAFGSDSLATAALTAPGNYKIRLTETRGGCSEKDSVSIRVKEVPVPDIKIDGRSLPRGIGIGLCSDHTLEMTIQGYDSVRWSGGFTGTSFRPDTSDYYKVQVWEDGCTARDTMWVIIHERSPKLTLTGPQSVCPGSENVPYTVSPGGINWQSTVGTPSGATLFVDMPSEVGSFDIKIYPTDYGPFCVDTTKFTVNTDSSFPATPIAGSEALCTGDTGMYGISTYPGATHKWNIIQTTPLAALQDTFGIGNSLITTAPGTIQLYQTETRKTSVMTCVSNSDTLPIQIKPNPAPEILADNQALDSLNVCTGIPVNLSTESIFDSFLWNAEHTGPQLTADAPGLYTLQVWKDGCTGADTFILQLTALQVPQFIGYCRVAQYELQVLNLDTEALYTLNGDTGTAFIITAPQKTLLKSVKGPCTIDTEVTVTAEDLKACPWDIPNIITPNGDGSNDRFEPLFISPATLKIYDRWGREVYSRENYRNEFTAAGLSNGIYFYRISGEYGEAQGWVEVRR